MSLYFKPHNAAPIHLLPMLVGAYTIQQSGSCQSKTAICGFSCSPVANTGSGSMRPCLSAWQEMKAREGWDK
jgi:hypothetical protein